MELEQSILNAFFACLQHDLSTRAEGEKFISQVGNLIFHDFFEIKYFLFFNVSDKNTKWIYICSI